MPHYGFTAILADCADICEAKAEAVYLAGADDATCRCGNGISAIDFDREAPDLETALRTALADVTRANLCVERFEFEPEALSPQP